MNRVKNCVFLVRKWSYTTFNTVNIRKMWEKKEKIRRTKSMTKKRSSEIFTLKMEIFPEIGPRKNFVVPPNSAPALRPCCWMTSNGHVINSFKTQLMTLILVNNLLFSHFSPVFVTLTLLFYTLPAYIANPIYTLQQGWQKPKVF